MRILVILFVFLTSTASAQNNSIILGSQIHSYKFSGPFQYLGGGINGGYNFNNIVSISGQVGYDRIYALGYKFIEDTSIIRFFTLGIASQVRVLKKKIVSPVFDLEFRTGVSKMSSGPLLNYEANPLKFPENEADIHGRFLNLRSSIGLFLLVEVDIGNFKIHAGPGWVKNVVATELVYSDKTEKMTQKSWRAGKIGVNYRITNPSRKTVNDSKSK